MAGTLSHVPQIKEFYKKIKDQCPQTIFYGTDVGHQYDTTGKWYLTYLEEHDLADSERYHTAEETIEQGRYYYAKQDNSYRENKMAENFIREYDKLGDEPVMGIYGSAHTDPDAMEYTTGVVPSMANQLKQYYGDSIQAEDLSWMAPEEMVNTEPYRTDTIQVNGKDYEASYFGNQDLSDYFEDFASRDFWRLEQAYEDFKDSPLAGDKLPYDNYPMKIEAGQVFVIDYTKKDGSVLRMYYRSTDGCMLESRPATEAFTVN